MAGKRRPYDLRREPRRGPNFQLLLRSQLRPMLRLPKEEFAVPFIVGASCVPLAFAGGLQAFWVTWCTSNHSPCLIPA